MSIISTVRHVDIFLWAPFITLGWRVFLLILKSFFKLSQQFQKTTETKASTHIFFAAETQMAAQLGSWRLSLPFIKYNRRGQRLLMIKMKGELFFLASAEQIQRTLCLSIEATSNQSAHMHYKATLYFHPSYSYTLSLTHNPKWQLQPKPLPLKCSDKLQVSNQI